MYAVSTPHAHDCSHLEGRNFRILNPNYNVVEIKDSATSGRCGLDRQDAHYSHMDDRCEAPTHGSDEKINPLDL